MSTQKKIEVKVLLRDSDRRLSNKHRPWVHYSALEEEGRERQRRDRKKSGGDTRTGEERGEEGMG